MINVTKSDIKDFISSHGGLYKLKDGPLKNSLNELCEIVEIYFLFGKPGSYILNEWEYNACLKMGEDESLLAREGHRLYDGYDKYISLESYFISFKRDQKLNSLQCFTSK